MSGEGERPDVPRAGMFNRFADAVAEASFRATVTRRRYRVRFEPNNRWWQITEAWPRVTLLASVPDDAEGKG